MPINRIVCDFYTEEPLTPRQQEQLSGDLDNSLQAVVGSEVEGRVLNAPSFHHGHVHRSSARRACDTCVALAQDERSHE